MTLAVSTSADNPLLAEVRQLINAARQLTVDFGKGWSEQQLRHCLRLAETFPDKQILPTVQRELSWSQRKALIYIDQPARQLRAIWCDFVGVHPGAKAVVRLQPLIAHVLTPPKNCFSSDFSYSGLNNYKNLESAILAELQRFTIELARIKLRGDAR